MAIINIKVNLEGADAAKEKLLGLNNATAALLALLIKLNDKKGIDLSKFNIDTSNINATKQAFSELLVLFQRNVAPQSVSRIAKQFGTTKQEIASVLIDLKQFVQLFKEVGTITGTFKDPLAAQVKTTKDLVAEKTRQLKLENELKRVQDQQAEAVGKQPKKPRDIVKEGLTEARSVAEQKILAAQDQELRLSTSLTATEQARNSVVRDIVNKIADIPKRYEQAKNSVSGISSLEKEVQGLLGNQIAQQNRLSGAAAEAKQPLIERLELLRQGLRESRNLLELEQEHTKALRESAQAAREQAAAANQNIGNTGLGAARQSVSGLDQQIRANSLLEGSVKGFNSALTESPKLASDFLNRLKQIPDVAKLLSNLRAEFGQLTKEISQATVGVGGRTTQEGIIPGAVDPKSIQILSDRRSKIADLINLTNKLVDVERLSADAEKLGISPLEAKKALLLQLGFLTEKETGISKLFAAEASSGGLGNILTGGGTTLPKARISQLEASQAAGAKTIGELEADRDLKARQKIIEAQQREAQEDQKRLAIIEQYSAVLGNILNIHKSTLNSVAAVNKEARDALFVKVQEITVLQKIQQAGGLALLNEAQKLKLAKELVGVREKLAGLKDQGLTGPQLTEARNKIVNSELQGLANRSTGQLNVPKELLQGAKGGTTLGFDPKGVRSLGNEINKAGKDLGTFNKLTLDSGKSFTSFNEQMTIAVQKIIRYRIAFTAMMQAYQAFATATKTVFDIEHSIAALAKVTDITSKTFGGLAEQAFELAKGFGVDVTTILESVQVFAQAGFTLEESFKLTQAALLGVNGASLSLAESTELLIGAVKTYKFEVSNLTAVLDKLVKVQAAYAVTTQDLAGALSVVGTAALNVGINFEEFLGIITAVVSVSRKSGREIGNSFKTIFARFTRPEVVKELQNGFDGVRVAVFNANGVLRDVSDILDDLHARWGQLNVTQKVNIATAIGGTRRYADFITLMENYTEALDATKDAVLAQGNAQRANIQEISTFSTQLKILGTSFKEVFFKIFTQTGGSALNTLKDMVLAVNKLFDVLKDPAAIKVLNIFAKGFISFATIAGFKGLSEVANSFIRSLLIIPGLAKKIDLPFETAGVIGFNKQLKTIENSLSNFKTTELFGLSSLVTNFKNGKISAKEFSAGLATLGLNEQQLTLSTRAHTAAITQQTAATTALTVAQRVQLTALAGAMGQVPSEKGGPTQLTNLKPAIIGLGAGEKTFGRIGKLINSIKLGTIGWVAALDTAKLTILSIGRALIPVAILMAAFEFLPKILQAFSGKKAENIAPDALQRFTVQKESILQARSEIDINLRRLRVFGDLAQQIDNYGKILKSTNATQQQITLANEGQAQAISKLRDGVDSFNKALSDQPGIIKDQIKLRNTMIASLEKEINAQLELRKVNAINSLVAVDSIHDEIKAREDLISQLQKLKSKDFQEEAVKKANTITGTIGSDVLSGNLLSIPIPGNIDKTTISVKDLNKAIQDNGVEILKLSDAFGIEKDEREAILSLLKDTLPILQQEEKLLKERQKTSKDLTDAQIKETLASKAQARWLEIVTSLIKDQESALRKQRDEIDQLAGSRNLIAKGILLTDEQKNKIINSLVDPFIKIQEEIRHTSAAISKSKRVLLEFGEAFDEPRDRLNKFLESFRQLEELSDRVKRFRQEEERLGEVFRQIGLQAVSIEAINQALESGENLSASQLSSLEIIGTRLKAVQGADASPELDKQLLRIKFFGQLADNLGISSQKTKDLKEQIIEIVDLNPDTVVEGFGRLGNFLEKDELKALSLSKSLITLNAQKLKDEATDKARGLSSQGQLDLLLQSKSLINSVQAIGLLSPQSIANMQDGVNLTQQLNLKANEINFLIEKLIKNEKLSTEEAKRLNKVYQELPTILGKMSGLIEVTKNAVGEEIAQEAKLIALKDISLSISRAQGEIENERLSSIQEIAQKYSSLTDTELSALKIEQKRREEFEKFKNDQLSVLTGIDEISKKLSFPSKGQDLFATTNFNDFFKAFDTLISKTEGLNEQDIEILSILKDRAVLLNLEADARIKILEVTEKAALGLVTIEGNQKHINILLESQRDLTNQIFDIAREIGDAAGSRRSSQLESQIRQEQANLNLLLKEHDTLKTIGKLRIDELNAIKQEFSKKAQLTKADVIARIDQSKLTGEQKKNLIDQLSSQGNLVSGQDASLAIMELMTNQSQDLTEELQKQEETIKNLKIILDLVGKSVFNLDTVLLTFSSISEAISTTSEAIVGSFLDLPNAIKESLSTQQQLEQQIADLQTGLIERQHDLNTNTKFGTEEWQKTQFEIGKTQKEIEDLQKKLEKSKSLGNIFLGVGEKLAAEINNAFKTANANILSKQLDNIFKQASGFQDEADKIQKAIEFAAQVHAQVVYNSIVAASNASANILQNALKSQQVINPAGLDKLSISGTTQSQSRGLDKLQLVQPDFNTDEITSSLTDASKTQTAAADLSLEAAKKQVEAQGAQIHSSAKLFAAASAIAVAGSAFSSVIGSQLPSPQGAAAGGNIGGSVGAIIGSFEGPVGTIVGGAIGDLAGSILGGLFGGKPKHPAPDPFLVNNTFAVNENTLAIRENIRTLNDLRSQLINAPANFTLPSFATFGGGFGGATQTNNNVNLRTSGAPTVSVTIIGATGDTKKIGTAVGDAVSDAYREQVSQFGFQIRNI